MRLQCSKCCECMVKVFGHDLPLSFIKTISMKHDDGSTMFTTWFRIEFLLFWKIWFVFFSPKFVDAHANKRSPFLPLHSILWPCRSVNHSTEQKHKLNRVLFIGQDYKMCALKTSQRIETAKQPQNLLALRSHFNGFKCEENAEKSSILTPNFQILSENRSKIWSNFSANKKLNCKSLRSDASFNLIRHSTKTTPFSPLINVV